MDHPDHISGNGSAWRQFASAWIAVIGILALFAPETVLRTDAVIALTVAGVTVVSWLSGRQAAVVLNTVWIIGRWMTSGEQSPSSLVSLGVLWAVMTGLICWITRLHGRVETEHRLARIDALTGLPNRQAFLDRCTAELSRARRFGRPVTLVLLDGDGFKGVNDRKGHAEGDRALKATAETMRHSLRQYDFVGRLGGDEFVILLPETSPPDAERAVHRLKQALQSEVEPRFQPLTYSIGAVTFFPGDWKVSTCLTETDRVLYLAKGSGKGMTRFETMPSA